MKTYAVIFKQIKGGFEVKSPSGKSITILNDQTDDLTREEAVKWMRYKNSEGILEIPVKDMEILLAISKKKSVKRGITIVEMKSFDKYYAFEMKFNDKRHEENYINKMVSKGYKHLGTKYI